MALNWKNRLCLLSLLASWVGGGTIEGQRDEIQLEDLTRRAGVEQLAVRISSDHPEIEALMARAFSAHGAYLARANGAVDFHFRFTWAGGNAVRLDLESGDPPEALFTETVSGSDWRNAALLAGDMAVRKTVGIPGFFGGQIAFVGGSRGSREVFVSDPFFGSVRRLTDDRAACLSPRFSPDGRFILYTGYFRNGFPDVYRIDRLTEERTVFASFRGSNSGATYSPAGTEVALVLSGSGNAELYRSDSEGRNIVRLTRTEDAVEADPSWSPDGRNIVFTSDRLGRPQLYRVSSRGGASERLRTNISGICAEPAWNPLHPNLIAFTIAQDRRFAVALFDVREGRSRVLTPGPGDALEAAWTNDGRHLIYTSGKGSRRRLVLLDVETGKSTGLQGSWNANAYQSDFVYTSEVIGK